MDDRLGGDLGFDRAHDRFRFGNPACCASQRGDSGSLKRTNQTRIAPTASNSTTQRQPDRPWGAMGTKYPGQQRHDRHGDEPIAC